jgi:hypothetical protein
MVFDWLVIGGTKDRERGENYNLIIFLSIIKNILINIL